MSEPMMHVKFDKATGDILAVGARPPVGESSIPVALSEVRGILEGTEQAADYQVQYNTKLKVMEFVSRHYTGTEGDCINDFIYEIPDDLAISDPDILVVQNVPEQCWKFYPGKVLQRNLQSKGITLNHTMMFSVTAKGDPNILFKTLFIELGSLLTDNYIVLPFDMPFEQTDGPISIYTSRRFDSYQLKRIFNEQ